MKNTFLILMCMISTQLFGQFECLEESFEDWEMVNGFMEPLNWETNNTRINETDYVTVSQSSNAVIGDFAARVSSDGYDAGIIGAPGSLKSTCGSTGQFNFLQIYYHCPVIESPGFAEISVFYWINGAKFTAGQLQITDPTIDYQQANIFTSFSQFLDSTTVEIKALSIENGGVYEGYAEILIDYLSLEFTVGLESLSNYEDLILVYPNPVHQDITINTRSNLNDVKILIYDVFGNLMSEDKYSFISENEIISMENYPNGIYFIKALIENEIVDVKRIIKL